MTLPLARPTTARRSHLPWPAVSILLALGAPLVALVPGAADRLELDRNAVASGELWRILTAHFTHWSVDQLAWDGAVFLVLAVLCERIDRRRMLAAIAGSAIVVSAGVLLLETRLDRYRGLSGIDSALFFLFSISILRGREIEASGPFRSGAAVLSVAFVGKVIAESVTGSTLFTSSGPSVFEVVPLAHLLGAVVGALAAFIEPLPANGNEIGEVEALLSKPAR